MSLKVDHGRVERLPSKELKAHRAVLDTETGIEAGNIERRWRKILKNHVKISTVMTDEYADD